jgi:2-iminobutanoate/2-iminopropanoate deaminase
MKYLLYFILLCVIVVGVACETVEEQRVKEIISTEHAPAAIGPYSQAVRVGDFLFISGQIPIDPTTNELEADDIVVQTERVLNNIGAVLSEAGLDYQDIVHCSVFLSDLNEFQAMNRVYARYFSDEPPSRATVEVARLPRDVKIEISAIAVKTVR